MENDVTLEVLDPTGDIVVKGKVGLASRLNVLEGKTIGLVWNGKKHADILLDAVEGLLHERFPTIKSNRYVMSGVSHLPEPGELEGIAEENDAIIYASGD